MNLTPVRRERTTAGYYRKGSGGGWLVMAFHLDGEIEESVADAASSECAARRLLRETVAELGYVKPRWHGRELRAHDPRPEQSWDDEAEVMRDRPLVLI